MIITDDIIRYRLIPYLATKADASPVLQKFAEEMRQKMGCWPQEQRIDGGTEFSVFAKWAKSMYITVTLSAPYVYEQNGVSEFSGFYLLQIARTMRIDAGVPQELQLEAINIATYIINRLRKPISKNGAQGHEYEAQGDQFH